MNDVNGEGPDHIVVVVVEEVKDGQHGLNVVNNVSTNMTVKF